MLTDEQVLAKLAQADGAILGWQLQGEEEVSFVRAEHRGVINFDTATDCYVHPRAVKIDEVGYTMDGAVTHI